MSYILEKNFTIISFRNLLLIQEKQNRDNVIFINNSSN